MADLPFIDRVIAKLAPERAVRREQARLQLEVLRSARAMYDGASRGHRTRGRKIGATSQDAEAQTSLKRLRNVARDMERNNAYAARGLTVIPTNVVGTGIIPSVTVTAVDPARKRATQAAQQRKAQIEDLIARHLDTTAIDFDGRQTFGGMQFTAVRGMARDGEILAVRYVPPASAGLPVPLQVRLLEADYLDTDKDGPTDSGGHCIQGVEFDSAGRRVAFWLFDDHPGSVSTSLRRSLRITSRRVPARDVAHLYRVDRPGQTRGIPWLAPAMMTLWDLKDYEDAELMRQKVAACFAAFETNPNGAGNLASSVTSKAGSPVDMLEPGMIHRLPPGHEITFGVPPQVNGYADYVRMNLRKVAAALGVPFNEIAADDSQENFASSRRGYLVFQRLIDVWRWQAVIPQFCEVVGNWFLEAATVPLGGPALASLEWTPPRRELISPKEEVPMLRDMIRSGLTSRSEALRSLGYDPASVDGEIAADNARSDGLDLSFDSDGRRPAAGPAQPAPEPQP